MTAQPSPDLPDSLQRPRMQSRFPRQVGNDTVDLAEAVADGDDPNSDDWKARCEQAWGQLDQAEADLAAMTARAESAEARVNELLADAKRLDPKARGLQ